MSMSYDEVWSVPAYRVNAFFESHGTAGCSVSVMALPERAVGALHFPQTHVKISGEKAEELYAAFRINFLSGGA